MEADLQEALVKRHGQDGSTPVFRDQCEASVLRILEKPAGMLPEIVDAEDVGRETIRQLDGSIHISGNC